MLNDNMGRILNARGQVCAVVVSGSCMATKPMRLCDPGLDKDIILGISTKNTISSHRLALPMLCEDCE